ncbi:hypothetical protein BDV12DRAFT_194756 [Aspergillus spectabilis]
MDSDIGGTSDGEEKFDLILFCHSLYGMKLKEIFIYLAQEMLVERPEGFVSVPNTDDALDSFAPFIAGFAMQDVETDKSIRAEWRKMCRALGRLEATESHPARLLFNAPDAMVAFTQHAVELPELTSEVPLLEGDKPIKNREACRYRPAAIVRPTEVQGAQDCVRWALRHGVSLTVIGGGHSGHSEEGEQEQETGSDDGGIVVVEAGCKTGYIVRKTMATGVSVPLGSRPSVGAGLWLQGGIGKLARLHGLACDSIVGAVVVSIATSQVPCIGRVPSKHCPAGAIHPDNETDLLWAIEGAGTNVGIVVSVTFETHVAPTFLTRNWVFPLNNKQDVVPKLRDFDHIVASRLPCNCSADAYLYWENGQLHLGLTMFESSTSGTPVPTSTPRLEATYLGPENDSKVVDGVGLFEAEMYILSGMHGGHGGGKTSSFKRCVFLKRIGEPNIPAFWSGC